MLEKTLESPLDCKIKPVNPKGNQSWIFIGRTESEALILWPPDAKSQVIRKHLDAGKEWRQEEKGMTEDEIVGWHQPLNGHELEQTQGGGRGQTSVCAAVHGVTKSRTRLSDWTATATLQAAWIEQMISMNFVVDVILIWENYLYPIFFSRNILWTKLYIFVSSNNLWFLSLLSYTTEL